MQANYPTAIPRNSAIALPVPAVARPKQLRAPSLARALARRRPALQNHAFRGQTWETVAWLALALSSLATLLVCLDI